MARKKKTDSTPTPTPIQNNVLKDLGKIEREKYADAVNKWHNIDDDQEQLIENELTVAALDDYSDDIHSVLENHEPINDKDTMKGSDLIKFILDNHLLEKEVFIFHPKCDDFYFLSKDIITTDRNKMIIHLS